MRVMRRHAGVSHVPEHPDVVANLKFLREPGEPEFRRFLADPVVPLDQFLDFVVRHFDPSRPGADGAWLVVSRSSAIP